MGDTEKLIGRPALLELLAEEASELAHAALKQARVIRGENPTPVTWDEAYNNLIEEYTDVIQCARELNLKINEDQIIRKDMRFHERINSHKEDHNG